MIIKTYLAGPIGKVEGDKFGPFNMAHKLFSNKGFEVVNPAWIGQFYYNNDPKIHGSVYLRLCLQHLLSCNSIALLPNWEDSVGARCEVVVARSLNMDFYDGLTGNKIECPENVVCNEFYDDVRTH